MLDVRAAVSDDLCSEIKARYRLKTNSNSLLRPLPSPELIALNPVLLLIPATETPLVNKLRKFLLHELLDLGHSLVQTLLRCAGNVKVQGWVRRRCHAFVGIVASTSGDIGTRLIFYHFLRRALRQQISIPQIVDLDILDVVAV